MADLKTIADKLLSLADSVNEYLPMAPATQGVIDLARGVGDLIDGFGEDIPAGKQAEAQEKRRLIAERVTAKSKQLSADLRG